MHMHTANPNRPSEVILMSEISAGVPMKDPIAPAVTPDEGRGDRDMHMYENEAAQTCDYDSLTSAKR